MQLQHGEKHPERDKAERPRERRGYAQRADGQHREQQSEVTHVAASGVDRHQPDLVRALHNLTFFRTAEAAARELTSGDVKPEPGRVRLLATRREVVWGWNEVADNLVLQDQVDLALAVRNFVKRLPPERTEREWIRDRLLGQSRARDDRDRSR